MVAQYIKTIVQYIIMVAQYVTMVKKKFCGIIYMSRCEPSKKVQVFFYIYIFKPHGVAVISICNFVNFALAFEAL